MTLRHIRLFNQGERHVIHQNTFQDQDVDNRALPEGTELLNGQYRIDRYLNSGGFGITYLATDSLNRRVVIKECFPEALCSRSGKTVCAKSTRHSGEFSKVVKMFVREARSLAQLDHPNIVGVHQIFETNDTAYMALDFIDGRDTLQLLEAGNSPLSKDVVLTLTECLLDAICAVHKADMLHRDISPDNILIDRDGRPCLIDFGAARQEATKKSRAVSALLMVKDGYSPQEFYISGGEQGPASDLYSIGATLVHLITGEAPPNSQNRLAALAAQKPDPYTPLEARVDGYDPDFLRAIDIAMSVFPKDRPQSAEQWIEIATGRFAPAVPDCATAAPLSRTVISDLVDEVATSIAEDSRIEQVTAKAQPDPEEACQPDAPEEHIWWPLNEQIHDETPSVLVAEEPSSEAEVVAQPHPSGSVRTRRRVGALVLIAALTFGYSEALSDHHLTRLTLDLESLIGPDPDEEVRL